MKQSERLDQLITLLANGEFHSGQAIGESLGISRAAVNQHIHKLEELGLELFSVTGRGYKLARPIELLRSQAIEKETPAQWKNKPEFEVRSVVDSSNDQVKELAKSGTLDAGFSLFAEAQTAGRGRRGKQWYSPFGSNLYLSIYWPLDDGIHGAMGLSLAVGVALAECFTNLGIDEVSVKWPNDVYIAGKKVTGILVDLETSPEGAAHSIIGIGINLRMPDHVGEKIDQAWTDLNSELPQPVSRNKVAAEVRASVLSALQQYGQSGLSAFQQRWQQYDRFIDKPVKLIMGQRVCLGTCRGIDENGALLVEDEQGVRRYFGGEVSLRAQDAIN
ncbi:MAG TPA: bifunctional biotin--[acetyl-CoA-carboxylase] synthetase/biotin operon repressor [Idiomarina abyssalis]|jgi:BirA family biotin operon repressor/biotin-[acetyl-CoA-carboxylase] ligase|uniref:bifunctional biotin--[acetyl-CoA-carboxylase] ligase/biotin operon repressor BirA n=1 Tax=Idiomarina TaxID=135575 RepID=UPI000E9C2D93|nr:MULTISPECIES: bifunctional biotin--[acetyl-CoA-carboxylase] ligase/biotin operon repressor BirA [Idiomarina]HAS13695.1 bifunctional biotin--[acetyl-CoA-carboxylase] synthetase/biotin operon repressor [Idiomarina abyssalis]|tara:strand:+ start:861 stop:1856 length:996 start_codon:yes stop_codon:yes gene_type:complete